MDRRNPSPSLRVFSLVLSLVLMTPGCSRDEGPPPGITGPITGLQDIPDRLDLEILYPARAAMIAAGGIEQFPLTLEGRVCDPDLGIELVRINGGQIIFDPNQECSTFSTVLPSDWGLNLLEGFAHAGGDRRVLRAQSYLRSPGWKGGLADPPGSRRVGQASLIHLRGDLLDDGDRLLPADDLATLVELAVAEVDIAAQVPVLLDDDVSDVSHDCGFWTEHNRSGAYTTRTGPMTYDRVTVDRIGITQGGIVCVVSVHDLHLPLKVKYWKDLGCLGDEDFDFYGDADADRMEITTNLAFTSIPGGPLQLVSGSTVVDLHGYSYDLDGFDLGGIIQDYVGGRINSGLKSGAAAIIQQKINEVIGSLFDVFRAPLAIDIPAPMAMTLVVETGWDSALLVPAEAAQDAYLQITSYLSVAPTAPIAAHVEAWGSIEGGGEPPALAEDPPSFAVALKEDLLNQILWAVWVGGGFDVEDLAAVTGISELTGLGIATSAHLPPVIMPGAEAGEIRLGIGDYYGELVLTEQVLAAVTAGVPEFDKARNCLDKETAVGAWFSLRQDGILAVDAETGRFDFGPSRAPEIVVEVVGLDDPYCQALIGNYLKETIGGALPSVLRLAIASFPAVNFPIPMVPGGLEWSLRGFELERMGRYHCIAGSLPGGPGEEVADHE